MHEHLNRTLHEIMGAPSKQGDVGVELEIEGTRLPEQVTGWEAKHEPSLRGAGGRGVAAGEAQEDTPREYVTMRPVSLPGLLPKLQLLERTLTTPPREVRLTPRGSTHIHLNMGTQTLHTFLGFLLVFVAVEPLLLRLCGPHRNGNIFCLPTYESGDLPEYVRTIATQDHHFNWPPRDKYASLNVGALRNLGSVEVRCFPNSISAAEIFEWATWLMNIRSLAADSDPTLEQLLDRMTRERNWLLRQVFGERDLHRSCAPHSVYDLFDFGAEQAYEIWRAMLPLFQDQPAPAENPVPAQMPLGLMPQALPMWRQMEINDRLTQEQPLRAVRRQELD